MMQVKKIISYLIAPLSNEPKIKGGTGRLKKRKAEIAHLRSRIHVQEHLEEAELNLEHKENKSN